MGRGTPLPRLCLRPEGRSVDRPLLRRLQPCRLLCEYARPTHTPMRPTYPPLRMLTARADASREPHRPICPRLLRSAFGRGAQHQRGVQGGRDAPAQQARRAHRQSVAAGARTGRIVVHVPPLNSVRRARRPRIRARNSTFPASSQLEPLAGVPPSVWRANRVQTRLVRRDTCRRAGRCAPRREDIESARHRERLD